MPTRYYVTDKGYAKSEDLSDSAQSSSLSHNDSTVLESLSALPAPATIEEIGLETANLRAPDPGLWWSEIRPSLRRLFEAGYIDQMSKE